MRFQPSDSAAGFTLVELLVTIAIIGILAALLLGVAAGAAESGRKAKTKQMITRLHTLLMEHYDAFRDRRVELSFRTGLNGSGITGAGAFISGSGLNARTRGELTAEARLHGLRELMITEMPDRWSDILLAPVPSNPSNYEVNSPVYVDQRSPIGELFVGKFGQIANGTNRLTGVANTQQEILANESAECLYLVIVFATGDGESRGLFNESDVADTDGDGAPEFVDGWGNPIRFIRWAPGADSTTQLNPGSLGLIRSDAEKKGLDGDTAIANAIDTSRDPMDIFRLQEFTAQSAADAAAASEPEYWGYSLLPYVYSDGGNEESGLVDARSWVGLEIDAADGYLAWDPSERDLQTVAQRYGKLRLDPIPNPFKRTNDLSFFLGHPVDRTAAEDNLTNHLLSDN